MNSQEAAALCRYTKACCPQQKFDEWTPDAWFDLLGDVPFQVAKAAVVEVAKRQPFVSPAEIRAQVGATHRRVAAEVGHVTPPWQLAEEPAREQRWLKDYRAAIASGESPDTATARANHFAGLPTESEPLAIESGADVESAIDQLRSALTSSRRTPVPQVTRRTPARWAADRGLQVVDPHNWDGDFRGTYTEAEFDERLGGVMTKPFTPVTEPTGATVPNNEKAAS